MENGGQQKQMCRFVHKVVKHNATCVLGHTRRRIFFCSSVLTHLSAKTPGIKQSHRRDIPNFLPLTLNFDIL